MSKHWWIGAWFGEFSVKPKESDGIWIGYPLGMANIAVEHGHRKFVSFPIITVDLSIVFRMFPRGYMCIDSGESAPWMVYLQTCALKSASFEGYLNRIWSIWNYTCYYFWSWYVDDMRMIVCIYVDFRSGEAHRGTGAARGEAEGSSRVSVSEHQPKGGAMQGWRIPVLTPELFKQPMLGPLMVLGKHSTYVYLSDWWFGTFFIFPYIGNNPPNWLIFFRGVETTNQLC